MKKSMRPRVLIIRLLEACNAGCFMCSFANSSDSYRFGLAEIQRLLSWIRDSDIRVVRFTGGEPLMLLELPCIVREVKRTGRLTSIITNGWALPERANDLVEAELDQIIVSLDGSNAAAQDRFRKLPGLFDRIVTGLRRISTLCPAIRLRVNTVVGPHNIRQLPAMLELLSDLRIEQWSLIPIKRDDRGFAARSLDEQLVALRVFQKALAARGNIGPKIIGPGAELLGRSSTEQEALWATGSNMTPNRVCNLVDIVRYYTPKDGLVYPCNCVPHREGQSKTSEVATPRSFSEQGLVEV